MHEGMSPLLCFGCLTSQQDVYFLFDPVFVVGSISVAYFLVPAKVTKHALPGYMANFVLASTK